MLFQGLNGNLKDRESLISELQIAAEPLQASCAPEVSTRVEAAVAEATKAWEETRDNIQSLCTRYQNAVKLWQKYRNASDVVREWSEQQMGTVANLPPEEALKQVKVSQNFLKSKFFILFCQENFWRAKAGSICLS